ncbi:MAG: hypothetical protein K1Y02_13680 [Candidatus Hydrogenedentes bacterium]|nr:hypothetical protein [Candidatus Hydrogenedentota bacterium]
MVISVFLMCRSVLPAAEAPRIAVRYLRNAQHSTNIIVFMAQLATLIPIAAMLLLRPSSIHVLAIFLPALALVLCAASLQYRMRTEPPAPLRVGDSTRIKKTAKNAALSVAPKRSALLRFRRIYVMTALNSVAGLSFSVGVYYFMIWIKTSGMSQRPWEISVASLFSFVIFTIAPVTGIQYFPPLRILRILPISPDGLRQEVATCLFVSHLTLLTGGILFEYVWGNGNALRLVSVAGLSYSISLYIAQLSLAHAKSGWFVYALLCVYALEGLLVFFLPWPIVALVGIAMLPSQYRKLQGYLRDLNLAYQRTQETNTAFSRTA